MVILCSIHLPMQFNRKSISDDKLISLYKGLLTPRMSTNFNQAISEREDKGIKSELTFIGMKESNLEKYEKVQDKIFATVKFVSDIISVKKDKNNNVLEGNPDRIKTVTDHWKFSKKETSNSPNWYLAEILPK